MILRRTAWSHSQRCEIAAIVGSPRARRASAGRRLCQPRAKAGLAGDERRAAGCAALRGVVSVNVIPSRPMRSRFDVDNPSLRAKGADVRLPDVVAPKDDDVRLPPLAAGWCCLYEPDSTARPGGSDVHDTGSRLITASFESRQIGHSMVPVRTHADDDPWWPSLRATPAHCRSLPMCDSEAGDCDSMLRQPYANGGLIRGYQISCPWGLAFLQRNPVTQPLCRACRALSLNS